MLDIRKVCVVLGMVCASTSFAQNQILTGETLCDDGVDNDQDGLVDCADASCYQTTVCQPGGKPEQSDDACGDWIDNDGDGAVDCDDEDCMSDAVSVCKGSWDKAEEDSAQSSPQPQMGVETFADPVDALGKNGDADGERTDEVCSDGIDNDNDGRVDCADMGCRLDPSVSVCTNAPNMRFSLVAGASGSWVSRKGGDNVVQNTEDARFQRLQLRALGTIPSIHNSFFLVNLRAERTPRLTFAMFQMPLGHGHYININSGSGTLSTSLIISAAKQLLLDPADYVYRSFEQGNGLAVDVGGPLEASKRFSYRVFAAGGSGEFNGNVGGRFFRSSDRNFTWTVGGQLQANIIGTYNRFDGPFLYTPVPLTVAAMLGAKYDQRAAERFPAVNAYLVSRWNRLIASAESYSKYDIDHRGAQTAFLFQLGYLAVAKKLLLAADYGEFVAFKMGKPPAQYGSSSIARPLNERQWRLAAHYYVYRNVGIVSCVYKDHTIAKNLDQISDPVHERELRFEAQIRF